MSAVRFRPWPPYSKARTRFGLFHVCPLRQFWRPFADLPCERHCSKTRIFPLYGPLCSLFYLFASRACARSVTVLMRVSVRSVVVGKWLPPATEVRPTSQSGGRCLRHARSRQQRTLRGTIEAASRVRADVIFMASHGYRGVKALLQGSETQKVLTHSTIPVMVYR